MKFVGRERDLKVLQDAYEEARNGQAKVVSIIAESGFGKTRLAQEFYNWLSTTHDAAGAEGYWPDALLQVENNIKVNPELGECGSTGNQMPFLWWGLRIADPGFRNQSLVNALQHGVEVFQAHQAAINNRLMREEIRKQRVNGVKSTAGEIASDYTVGLAEEALNLASFGLFGLAKTLAGAGQDQFRLRKEMQELEKEDLAPEAVSKRQHDRLTETLLNDLRIVAKHPPKGLNAAPIVILVDDIQWISSDPGVGAFLESLLEQARAESWPLLLVLTCWRSEWVSSKNQGLLPGALISNQDIELELGRTSGLEEIIKEAFSGLSEGQRTALLMKVDGNPRLLGELLRYLSRNKKYFENRDANKSLTEKGLSTVLDLDIGEFFADRLYNAPESVQRALAIASLQGPLFSPSMVDSVANELDIPDSKDGLEESENPHSFTLLGREGEFRLRMYSEVAREALGNFVDEDAAEKALALHLQRASEDPSIAEELVLKYALSTALDEAVLPQEADNASRIVKISAELIRRANERADVRSAGRVASRAIEYLEFTSDEIGMKDYMAILNADIEWSGEKTKHRDMLEGLVDRKRAASGVALETRRDLADALNKMGAVVKELEGPAAARAYHEEAVARYRACAEERPKSRDRNKLASALGRMGLVVGELEGPASARVYFAEAVVLYRALAEEQPTSSARRQFALALSNMGCVVEELEDPVAARACHGETVAMFRTFADEQPTPGARSDLAIALGRMGRVVAALEGPAAARPYHEEVVALYRALAEEQPTSGTRRQLALALSNLGRVVEELEGPVAARACHEETVAMFRACAEERPTPTGRRLLAIALNTMGQVVEVLEGPAAARPHHEESVALYRALAEEQPTSSARRQLALSLSSMGFVVEELEGLVAARAYHEETVALFRALADEQPTPSARRELAMAINKMGAVAHNLDDLAEAQAYYEEVAALCRALADEQPTPSARRELAIAINSIGDVAFDLDDLAGAQAYYEEAVALKRALAEEQPTFRDRRELAIALALLGSVVNTLEGPAAARGYFEEAVLIAQSLAEADPSNMELDELAFLREQLDEITEKANRTEEA